MKKFLAILLVCVISPFYYLAITAWSWLPILFIIGNILGGPILGFVLGLCISLGTEFIYHKLVGDN